MKNSKTILGIGLLWVARAMTAAAAQYGMVSQNDPAISAAFGGNGCAPTAVINSFVYLDSIGANLLPANQTLDQDVIALGGLMGTTKAGGTSAQGGVNGKSGWITANDSRVYMEGQAAPGLAGGGNNVAGPGMQAAVPTLAFIQQQLAAGEDVELWFNWQGGFGGHVVTATGLGNGTINFIDPSGAANVPNGGAVAINGATIAQVNNPNSPWDGYLQVTYAGGGAGAGGGSGYVSMVTAESLPEISSTAVLLGVVSLMFAGVRRFTTVSGNV